MIFYYSNVNILDKQTSKMSNIVFKLLTIDEWNQFKSEGKFVGTMNDINSGFIHMSQNMEQVNRIKQKYYSNEIAVLLSIDTNLLPIENFKYEPISTGEIYPHLYRALEIEYVMKFEFI